MVKKGNDSLTFVAVGDILVASKHYQSSFAKVNDILRGADIAFFNCETPYAEKGSPGVAQHGAVPHDPTKMPVLLSAGFDVCTLANNHTLDWGIDAVIECRERLEGMGIAVCGAGRDITEARKPAVLERKGTKIAFLGYCTVGPNGYMAEEDKPGCAMVRAHTWYEPYEYQPGTPPQVFTLPYKDDLEGMIEDIKKAKEEADIVVMTDHWGIHHAPAIIPDYEFDIAHAAIDAGADLVLGTHPHILKGMEVYKGKVIAHSMANFVMEGGLARKEGELRNLRLKSWAELTPRLYRPRHPDQCKSLILKCQISGKKIQHVSYLPVQIDANWTNPEPLTQRDPRAQEIFHYIEEITRTVGFDTKFSWDGDEVVIRT